MPDQKQPKPQANPAEKAPGGASASSGTPAKGGKAGKTTRISAPKGTRDLYPEDVLRQRYITNAWRDVSIRHGFEEIAGPTFEMAELYAVKSGDGILSELFQAFSGKSPDEVEQVKATGQAPYALRPEFTPTLARMYAAHAKQLPKPCKWFTAGPYFRAERPQRGRLREFLQWNCDVIGGEGDDLDLHDFEVAGVLISACVDLGLSSADASLMCNDRRFVAELARSQGVVAEDLQIFLWAMDSAEKKPMEAIVEDLRRQGVSDQRIAVVGQAYNQILLAFKGSHSIEEALTKLGVPEEALRQASNLAVAVGSVFGPGWAKFNRGIARGLAYYTGTVFEVIAEGERAIAGGGRYDNLIELFGGPPTPACGFGMGDVVLGILLDEKGLIPEGKELMDAVSRPGASVRPEAFVINGGNADDAGDLDAACRRLVADLRRGVVSKAHEDRGDDAKPWHADRYESASGGVRPLHARHTYKSTRNLKKLLADAEKQFARFAVVVHEPGKVELRDLDSRHDLTPVDVPGLPSDRATFSVDSSSPVYVGRAIAALLG